MEVDQTPSTEPLRAFADILRCPVTGQPLRWSGQGFTERRTGRHYPYKEGILDLTAPEEREADLGDSGHYDEHPFDCFRLDDAHSARAAVEPELQAFIARVPSSGRIADIGCGPGRVSIYLHEEKRVAISLDYSLRSLQVLRPHVSHPLLRGNNLKLPLADASLDAVVSTGVIHHTPDPMRALRENCRVLAPGGLLYLHAYRAGSYYDFLYHRVGGPMRALRRLGGPGRALVDQGLFGVYRFMSLLIKPGRSRDPRHQRNLFENYFLKTLVHPLQRSDLEGTLAQMDMEILSYRPTGQMHRYVARRRPSGS